MAKIFKNIFSFIKNEYEWSKRHGYVTIFLMTLSAYASAMFTYYSAFKSGLYVPIGALRGCEDGIEVLREQRQDCQAILNKCINILDQINESDGSETEEE